MKELLASGCEQVFLENRVVREAIGDYGEKADGDKQIREIVAAVGLANIGIEITNQASFESRNCHRFWAVRTFGPEVNFAGGSSLDEIRYVEAIRRGIIFIPGPSKSSSRLWVRSLARHGGTAAPDWWNEPYPIDAERRQDAALSERRKATGHGRRRGGDWQLPCRSLRAQSKRGSAVGSADRGNVVIAGKHDDFRADVDAAVEIDDIRIQHPDATARYLVPDRLRAVGPVDSVDRVAEIDGARTERVALAAGHPPRQIGLARDHLLRRRPVRPFRLAGHRLRARPGETVTADTDAVADRFAVAEDVVEMGLRGIDDDGAGREIGRIADHLAVHLGGEIGTDIDRVRCLALRHRCKRRPGIARRGRGDRRRGAEPIHRATVRMPTEPIASIWKFMTSPLALVEG